MSDDRTAEDREREDMLILAYLKLFSFYPTLYPSRNRAKRKRKKARRGKKK